MSIPIRSNVDLGLSQLLSAVVEVVGSDPATPTLGRIIVRSDTGDFKIGNGSQWNTFYRSTVRLDQISPPTAALSLNSQKITSVADGTVATDVATWGQVLALVQGMAWKDNVRAATTGNVVLSGTQTIDGVALSAGDRVLVKNQTSPPENGIYVVASGGWTRATDADSTSDIQNAAVLIDQGTVNADTAWTQTADNVTIGSSTVTWVQFASGNSPSAGLGLSLNSGSYDVNVDDSSIEINTDTLRVKAGGITNAMLAGAIDLTSKVTGQLPIANGGTAASSASAARTNLVAVTAFSADVVGDGATTGLIVDHNLGTKDIQAQVWEATTDTEVLVEKVRTTINRLTLNFGTAPANGKTYRVVVMARA